MRFPKDGKTLTYVTTATGSRMPKIKISRTYTLAPSAARRLRATCEEEQRPLIEVGLANKSQPFRCVVHANPRHLRDA